MAFVAPAPRTETQFRFQQLKKLRIFDDPLPPGSNPTNLLAVSNKFGLVFVGNNKGIIAIKTVDIQKEDDGHGKYYSQSDIAVDYPYKEIPIQYKLSHIALSCDDLTLAACLQIYKSPCAHLYDVRAFADNVGKIEPFVEVRLSASPTTEVVDYAWNPTIPTLFAVCLSDGAVSAFDITDAPGGLKVFGNIPPSVGATAICWSPKGKQIVVGKKDGTMVQYKPDLQEAKSLPAPTGLSDNPTPVVSICWISNFDFVTAYKCEDHISLIFVHSKGGQTNFVNYDDVCYGTSCLRPYYYYMFHQPDWHMVFCASSNAIEIGVLGSGVNDKESWIQWVLDDSGRAELPLSKTEETGPIGFAVDTTSQYEIPLDEIRKIPPMPIVYLLSSDGLLCPFYMINTMPNTPSIVKGPETLAATGLRKKAAKLATSTVATPMQNAPVKITTQIAPTRPFADLKPPPYPVTIPDTVPQPPTSAATEGIRTGIPITSAVWKVLQPSAPEQTIVAFSKIETRQPDQTLVSLQNVPATGIRTVSKPEIQTEIPQPTQDDFTAAIIKEISEFKSEMAEEMKLRLTEVAIEIGTKEELEALKKSVETVDGFSNEIKKTLQSLQGDTHTLGNCILEAFTMLEEKKFCSLHAQDPRLQHLLRQRPLDPVNAKKMRDMLNLYMYLESQIEEVHDILDRFILANKKPNRLNLPNMEAVHNIVANSNRILKELAYKVGTLKKRVEDLKMSSPSSGKSYGTIIELERNNKDLSLLADSLLKTKLSPEDSVGQFQQANLTAEKYTFLRDFFTNRTVATVRPQAIDISSRLTALTLKPKQPEEKPKTPELPKTPEPAAVTTKPIMPIMTSTPIKFLHNSFVPVENPEPRIHILKPKVPVPSMENTHPNIFTLAAANTGKPQTALAIGGIQVGTVGPRIPDVFQRKTIFGTITTTLGPNLVQNSKERAPMPVFSFGTSQNTMSKSFDATVGSELSVNINTGTGDWTTDPGDKKLFSPSEEGDAESTGYEDVTPPSSPVDEADDPEGEEEDDEEEEDEDETGEDEAVEAKEPGQANSKPTMPEIEKNLFEFKLPAVPSAEKIAGKSNTNLFASSGFKFDTSFGQGFTGFGTVVTKPVTPVSTSSSTSPSLQAPLLSSILGTPTVTPVATSAPSSMVTFSFKQFSPTPPPPPPPGPASVSPVSPVVTTPPPTVTESSTPKAVDTVPQVTTSPVAVPQAATVSSAAGFSFNSASPPASGFSLGHLQSPTASQAATFPSSGFGTPVTAAVASPANFSFSLPAMSSPVAFGQGQTAATTTAGSSQIFGGSQGFTTTVPFKFESSTIGKSGSTFGQTTGFGQNPATPAFSSPNLGSSPGSAFGQSPTFGQTTSTFGQVQPTPATSPPLFGQQQPATSTGGLFGSNASSGFFTGLGGKPSPDNAAKNIFGVPSTNTSTTPTTNLFGSGTTASVQSPKFGGTFSGGNFSVAGAPSVAQTGFGSFQQTPPKPAVEFGGSGAFGASATFGGGPKFGTSSTFGGTPAFGAPTAVTGGLFGNAQNVQTNFDSFAANTSAPTFGSLAAQTSPAFGTSAPQQQGQAFGALAQQQQQQPAFGTTGFGSVPAFGGNSSFGSQGSQSFNQWRS